MSFSCCFFLLENSHSRVIPSQFSLMVASRGFVLQQKHKQSESENGARPELFGHSLFLRGK